MKRDSEKEVSNFQGIFFAFSDKQFNEGREKIGLKADDKKKIFSLGAGGYILKEKSKAFRAMFDRFSNRMETALRNEAFLLDALIYELYNHEYCITYDTTPALEALVLKIGDILQLSFGSEVLKKACAEASKDC